jgi:thiamine biosynthesis lipoprotein
LHNEALATSGNYIQKGHIIDPRTRRPVDHDTVSVSVVAPSAMQADAWATALLVLGAETGKAIAERNEVEALFLTRKSQALQETSASWGAPSITP